MLINGLMQLITSVSCLKNREALFWIRLKCGLFLRIAHVYNKVYSTKKITSHFGNKRLLFGLGNSYIGSLDNYNDTHFISEIR